MKDTIRYCGILLLLMMGSAVFAQKEQVQKNWQLMDLKTDGLFGISMEKAYGELLKGRKAEKVIVAVIDAGADIKHEDLKQVIYTNTREVPGNKRDDDKNHYTDDVHGWNFLGTDTGSYVYGNMDLTRELRLELKKDPNSEKTRKLKVEFDAKRKRVEDAFKLAESNRIVLRSIITNIGRENPSIMDFRNYRARSYAENNMLAEVVRGMKANPGYLGELEAKYNRYKAELAYYVNMGYDPRADRQYRKKYYGNPDVGALNPFHGTHIAGIIAADRNNDTGIRGVADQVWLLPIRAIPFSDYLDRDVAMAIRYAVDMGAKVINLSFGKGSSPDRKLVDDAVKYAMERDVLIVRAAGNDGRENTGSNWFPVKSYADGGEAAGWIEVGASGFHDDGDLAAWFSNYSGKYVDVFAPGVRIYSTMPGNRYEYLNGTSMAAPVVSGLAGMLRAYFPKLSAVQVKEIIMRSVVKRDVLKDKCVSGGVVNAYEAFKLAATY